MVRNIVTETIAMWDRAHQAAKIVFSLYANERPMNETNSFYTIYLYDRMSFQ